MMPLFLVSFDNILTAIAHHALQPISAVATKFVKTKGVIRIRNEAVFDERPAGFF